MLSSSSMLGAQRLVVVLDPCDGGFAEETVLVVHQMLIDAGFAGFVRAGLEDGRDGVSIADGAEVFFTGGRSARSSLFGFFCEKCQHEPHFVFFLFTDVVGVCMKREVLAF